MEAIIGDELYSIVMMWGMLDIAYGWIFLFMITPDKPLWAEERGGTYVSYKIADSYCNMTKIGLIIMMPIRSLFLVFEFGGIILVALFVLIDFWFIFAGSIAISLLMLFLGKIMFKG